MPEDAQYMLNELKDLDGFYGASSMERLPTEVAIKSQVEKFAQIKRT
jgi:predicted TIM-barrel enzyme